MLNENDSTTFQVTFGQSEVVGTLLAVLNNGAAANDVRSGKQFYNDDGETVTGTIETYSGESAISQNGVIATEGKYLEEDLVVNVQPVLQSKTVNRNGQYFPEDGFDGFSDVMVAVSPLLTTVTVVPENLEQVITPSRPMDGFNAVIVEGDVNFSSENIKSGVSIFGVEGEYLGEGMLEGGISVEFYIGTTLFACQACLPGYGVSPPPDPKISGSKLMGWLDEQGEKVNFPYYPTETTKFYADLKDQVVIGFTGLTNPDSVLTWTDDIAEGFGDFTVVTEDNLVTVSSPLDRVFPYNEIEEYTDDSGNCMVRFPKIYMKWVLDESGYVDGVKFSNVQVDDTYFLSDAYYNTADSVPEYFSMGKYECGLDSDSKAVSKSGQAVNSFSKRGDARTACRAAGEGYEQLTFPIFTLYNLLCMLYYRTSNIQSVFPGRTKDYAGIALEDFAPTGSTDGIEGLNGWNTMNGCVKMLGIENPYGNKACWLDGGYIYERKYFTQRFPASYSDAHSTTDSMATDISIPSKLTSNANYITHFLVSNAVANRSLMLPAVITSEQDVYISDHFNVIASDSFRGYFTGGDMECNRGRAGLWYFFSTLPSVSQTSVGARLTYRP